LSLKARVLRGSLWSLAGGSGQQLIAFFTFLYLAKVLDARAVGIVASAAILSDITVIFAKLGLVEAIQRQDPDRDIEGAAWWCSALSGVAGAALMIAASFIVRQLTDQPEIANVLLILAPVAVLSAVTAVPEGLIRRSLKFRALSIRTWVATLAGGVAAVSAVWFDFGLYALAIQRLATAVIGSALIWLQAGWRPVAFANLRSALHLVRSGFMIVVGNFSGIVNARVSDSITALFLGAAPLGYLRLSSRFSDVIVTMVVTPVVSVALPSFAQVKNDRAALKRSYLRLTQFMAVVAIPAYFGLGAIAEPFIRALLGEKWLGALVAFQFFGFGITAGCVNYFFSPLMVAIGRADIVMKQSVTQVLLSIPLVWAGAQYGLTGVVLAGVVRASIVSIMNTVVIARQLSVKVRSIVFQWAPPFVSSLVMFGACKVLLSHLPSDAGDYVRCAAAIALGLAVYSVTLTAGDFLGLWRGYVRNGLNSLRGGLRPAGL